MAIPYLKKKNSALLVLIVLLVLVWGLMVQLKSCAGKAGAFHSEKPFDLNKDTLNVAIIYSPMSYYIYNDSVGGLCYDLLLKFSEDRKIPLKLRPVVSLETSLDEMRKGKVDMLASLPVNSEMMEDYIFSPPVYLDRQVLVQLRDSVTNLPPVKSALELAGDTVNVVKDSPAVMRLQNLSEEIGEPIFIKTHNSLSEEYLVLKVVSGEIPLAVVNEKTARRLQRDFSRLDFSTPVSFTQFQSWVVMKRDSLLMKNVSQWVDSIKQTPSYQNILLRYTSN